MPVDSPWRTRINTEVDRAPVRAQAGHQWTRIRSHWGQVAKVSAARCCIRSISTDGRVRWQPSHRSPTRRAAPTPPRWERSRSYRSARSAGSPAARLGPGRRLDLDGRPQFDLGPRPPPRTGGPPRPRVQPPSAGGRPMRWSSGSSSSIRTSSSSSSERWRSANCVTSWSTACRSLEADDRAGPHPGFQLVTPFGRRPDPLLQCSLAAGQIVHLGLDLGHRHPQGAPGAHAHRPGRCARAWPRSGRCSWSSAVSWSWTLIKVSYGSAIALLGRPPGPVSEPGGDQPTG